MRIMEVMQSGIKAAVNCDQVLYIRQPLDGESGARIVFTGGEERSLSTDTPYEDVVAMWRSA